MTEQPATLLDEIDDVIAEGEAEAAELTAPEGIKATAKALLYAGDFGVDIKLVTGTGTEGKITVPDVQKYKKEMDALVEAEAAVPEVVVEEPKEEKPKKKPQKRVAKGKASTKAALVPSLRTGLSEVYHIVRSVHEFGMGWESQIVTKDDADYNIGKMLQEGWVIVRIQALNVDMDGIRMLWVMGKPETPLAENVWPYREIQHFTRPLGGAGDDGRGITGEDANKLVSGYLMDGWDLAMVEALGMGTGVVNVMWVLIR